jgi:hypothetical protein
MTRCGKHYPALDRSKDPAFDIVAQLRTWLRVAGLAVYRSCAKRAGRRLAAKYAPRYNFIGPSPTEGDPAAAHASRAPPPPLYPRWWSSLWPYER